jgi:hypothetical protein
MIRWYISPYSGAGTPLDPFHARCWDFTDPEKDKCTGTRCPQKRHYIVRVDAPQAAHDAIIANNAGTIISPLYQDAAAEVAALDIPFLNPAEKLAVDNHGYPLEWMSATHTLRHMLRHIVRMMHMSQRFSRSPVADRLFTVGLSSTVSDLTVPQRNAIRTFVQNHGFDITWITNQTTMRQLLRRFVDDLGPVHVRVGKLEL